MGHCIVAGGKPDMNVPSAGILASELAVGSTVKLMENGSAVEYLVVNQGKPQGSSMYDDSCNGTWLLRKNCYSKRAWNTTSKNEYSASSIHTWLNNSFFNVLGSIEQSAIKQVKIPYFEYYPSGSIQTGQSGLDCKIFLLSVDEVHYREDFGEGKSLTYFANSSINAEDSKRIAYYSGSATVWWLRSPYRDNNAYVWYIKTDGACYSRGTETSKYGIRPALVLPSNALFDENTLILKGVS